MSDSDEDQIICVSCRVPPRATANIKGRNIHACPHCGQSDAIGDIVRQAIEHEIGKPMPCSTEGLETALSGHGQRWVIGRPISN